MFEELVGGKKKQNLRHHLFYDYSSSYFHYFYVYYAAYESDSESERDLFTVKSIKTGFGMVFDRLEIYEAIKWGTSLRFESPEREPQKTQR